MTLGKLERHAKPIVLANFGGFWSPWLALLAHLETEGSSAPRSGSDASWSTTPRRSCRRWGAPFR